MIGAAEIKTILDGYDKNRITIGVLGSHSALDVCRGAKDEGFSTLVVCQMGRERTYAHHYRTQDGIGIVDHVIVLENFSDIMREDIQAQLRALNVIFVPHRAFEVYLDFNYAAIENDFLVPLFGARSLLRIEERNQQYTQYNLLHDAQIRMPHIFSRSQDIDRLCLVKIPEKTRAFERSFFYCSSGQEFDSIINQKIECNEIDPAVVADAVIEEYVVGPVVNFNYFYSPLSQRVELLGTDMRRQTNVDGIARLDAHNQEALHNFVAPKFEEAGHVAVTVLESMLEKAFEYGDRFVQAAREKCAPGIVGPFALQSIIVPGPPKKDIVVFDVSLRMPGSPGICFTPYSRYLHGQSLSAGQRVALEIKHALRSDRIAQVVT
jgi:5-formaminoimidazole-4-carboxamide-1-(beta)-D-ribofuranosyl 5'-monophosphate synthetase